MYLTYDEYSQLGGRVEQSAFPALERKARHKIDYFTQNRLKDATVIIDAVKDCMAEFIDKMADFESGDKVASFTNGGVSVSFQTDNRTDDAILYDIAVEYLPVDLISLVVE